MNKIKTKRTIYPNDRKIAVLQTIVVVLMMLLCCIGCCNKKQMASGGYGVDSVCLWIEPITITKKEMDTLSIYTLRQIDAHNMKLRIKCGNPTFNPYKTPL